MLINTENIPILEYSTISPWANKPLWMGLPTQDIEAELDKMNGYAIHIPRAYARLETKEYPNKGEVESVDHYTLYVTRQAGSQTVNRDTYIYTRLPKSGMMVNIVIHPSGGAEFDPRIRKYVLREYDELDRRILLGFCDNYWMTLVDECHTDKPREELWLAEEARRYNAKQHAKRVKKSGNTEFYTKYRLTDEGASLFDSLAVI